MQTILMSIHPKWCEKIFNGEKTIEVRKTAPKPPFKVVVYCTKGDYLVQMPDKKSCRIYPKREYRGMKPEPDFMGHKRNGKVIGEFICDKVEQLQYQTTIPCIKINENDEIEISGNTAVEPFYNGKVKTIKESCLTQEQLLAYGQGKDLYGIHITATKLYDKPKELGEFYSIKQCKPEYSPFGYQWTWEDRHKRKIGGWDKEHRPVPIECHRCKSLVGGKDYLDEKSGCILFDYECVSKYHKPLERPPQSYMRIQDTKEE